MDQHRSNIDRKLRYCSIGLFLVYMIVLFRITLFKQVALYNLFAAIGASERTVSIIPFQSVFEMISSGVSLIRIIENILGNIAIFVPFGLLIPIISKEKGRKTIIYGIAFSLFIEVIQFAFALGSSDIDDLIFNTLGVFLGYVMSRIISKKLSAGIYATISTLILVIALGVMAFGILLINHTDLFMISRKEIVVKNPEIVQDFINTPQYISGRFCYINGTILTIEKSVHNADEERTLIEMEITPGSKFFICYDDIEYFFSSISSEKITYEQIEYSDFISRTFTKDNNVRIWSSDEKTVENLVITEWEE